MKNAMTVDVEEYFQVSAFERFIGRDAWDRLPSRVEESVRRILKLFAAHDVQATFFVLGWVAERQPALIRAIAEAGHEVASHGYEHIRATEQTPAAFRADVIKTKAILEDLSGRPVCGYRAATFSISPSNLWVWAELAETGHEYSSSLNPIHHDLYGIPGAPRAPFRPNGHDLVEVPITTFPFLGRNWPAGGGGFFRLLPVRYFASVYRKINGREARPAVFYFHPWEIDPDQPRLPGLPLKTRFRHYVRLSTNESRLERLLAAFRWGRMDETFLAGEQAGALPSLEVQPA